MVNSHTLIYNDFISRIVYLWENEIPSQWIPTVSIRISKSTQIDLPQVFYVSDFPKATDQKYNLCIDMINCYLFQCDLQATVKSFLTKIIYLTYLLQNDLNFTIIETPWLMNFNAFTCKFMVPRTSINTWGSFNSLST